MTLSRRHFAFLLLFTVAVFGLGHWATGRPLSSDRLELLALALGGFVALGAALEYVLWRLPLFHGWFIARPDLRGTWRVEVHPDVESYQAVGQRLPPPAYLGISQTLSSMKMHLMSPETESWFISDALDFSARQGGYQLVGVYKTRPHARRPDHKNEIHLGGMVMETLGAPHHRPTSMRGQYWTDRRTRGTVVLTRTSRRVYHHYSETEKGR